MNREAERNVVWKMKNKVRNSLKRKRERDSYNDKLDRKRIKIR